MDLTAYFDDPPVGEEFLVMLALCSERSSRGLVVEVEADAYVLLSVETVVGDERIVTCRVKTLTTSSWKVELPGVINPAATTRAEDPLEVARSERYIHLRGRCLKQRGLLRVRVTILVPHQVSECELRLRALPLSRTP
ncbi:MAG: hypothetical protein AAGE52_20075 [Myxococcota bacterium]